MGMHSFLHTHIHIYTHNICDQITTTQAYSSYLPYIHDVSQAFSQVRDGKMVNSQTGQCPLAQLWKFRADGWIHKDKNIGMYELPTLEGPV